MNKRIAVNVLRVCAGIAVVVAMWCFVVAAFGGNSLYWIVVGCCNTVFVFVVGVLIVRGSKQGTQLDLDEGHAEQTSDGDSSTRGAGLGTPKK